MRTLPALLAAALLTTGCTHPVRRVPTPSTPVTLTLRVPGDRPAAERVAEIVGERLAALPTSLSRTGAPKIAAGSVTFALSRKLTAAEAGAVTAVGSFVIADVTAELQDPRCGTAAGRAKVAKAGARAACGLDDGIRYALGPPAVTNADLVKVSADPDRIDHTAPWTVQLTLRDADAWKRYTGARINRQIALVVDGVVRSAPRIYAAIPGGAATVSGSFSEADATALAATLAAGPLQAGVTATQR